MKASRISRRGHDRDSAAHPPNSTILPHDRVADPASPDGRTILYSRTDSSVDDLMLVENFR